MEKISGVYKITNTITGDFYIGSSKNVKRRWVEHKWPSVWKNYPNNQMYIDMKNYGIDKFDFQILEEVEPDSLKVIEQMVGILKDIKKLKKNIKNLRKAKNLAEKLSKNMIINFAFITAKP